jgi:hypothetical protein
LSAAGTVAGISRQAGEHREREVRHRTRLGAQGKVAFPQRLSQALPMTPADVAAQFAPLVTAFPDWHWQMRHIVIDGDDIVVHFTVTGTHRGPFRGIEATGRRIKTSEFTMYHVSDGKFAGVWDLLDVDTIMQQIG